MSLINDHQRTRSSQQKPTIKPLPSVKPAPATQQLEQMNIESPTPAAAPATGESLLPMQEQLPNIADAGEPIETGQFPDAMAETQAPAPADAMVAAPPVDNALNEALDLTPPMQDGVGVGTRIPTPEEIMQNVGRAAAPTVLQDIGNQYGDDRIYAPDIIVTKVPTVYNTLDTKSTYDLVKQGYAGIDDGIGRRDAQQQQAAAQTQQLLEDRNRFLNVPRVDKPWNASPAANNSHPMTDILFGNEQHRREQPFKPQEGSYGKQGAGLLGGLNYLLNLPLNLSVGAIAEANEATANIFKTFGVSEKDAQNYARNGLLGLLPEKMRPSSLLGFDWKKAQSRNLIQDALTGDPVGDTNDPKGKHKGVFYSPRRAQNVRSVQIPNKKNNPLVQVDQAYNDVIAVAQNDPIGTAIEVGIQLFNPGDAVMDKVWNSAWRALSKKAGTETAQRAVRATPQPKKGVVNAKPAPPKQLPPAGQTGKKPGLPPAQSPSPGMRVQNGSAQWNAPGEIPALGAPAKVSGKKPSTTVGNPNFQSVGLPQVPGYTPNLKPQVPSTVPKKPDVVQAQIVNAAQAQKAPRVQNGDVSVVQKALPPAIDPVAFKGIDIQALLNTPSGTALKVGIGKPSTEPLMLPPGVSLKGIDDLPDGIKGAGTIDLLDAAEELAAHKAVLMQPLKQLDDLFETTVDFGRRPLNDVPFERQTANTIDRSITNGAKLNVPEAVFKRLDDLDPELGRALREGDYDALAEWSSLNGIPTSKLNGFIAEANNAAINDFAFVEANPSLPYIATDNSRLLFHGTALAEWTPNYNTLINGSRGELGSGLYLIDNMQVAEQYAKARMGENVTSGALQQDIEPAVYAIKNQFEATLSARYRIPTSKPFFKDAMDGLPEELQSNVMRSIQRDKHATYVSLLNKIEANLVRSGIEPTEQILRQVNDTVSDNLRKMGYDSVFDKQSGFMLALDEIKPVPMNAKLVEVSGNPTDAIVNRYNVDAYAAKHYPERLTTDANLRDSAAKVLNQTEDSIDSKLREVQQEIIARGYDKRPGVLPERDAVRDAPAAQTPETVELAFKDIEARSNNPCQP